MILNEIAPTTDHNDAQTSHKGAVTKGEAGPATKDQTNEATKGQTHPTTKDQTDAVTKGQTVEVTKGPVIKDRGRMKMNDPMEDVQEEIKSAKKTMIPIMMVHEQKVRDGNCLKLAPQSRCALLSEITSERH